MTKPVRTRFNIPLYGNASVLFSVSDDIVAERNREAKTFGPYRGDPQCLKGLASHSGLWLAIFLRRDAVTHNTAAHEILHTTFNLLEEVGVGLTPDNHEPFAYLNGYLTDRLYAFFRKHNIKPK